MTAKEKADELFLKFTDYVSSRWDIAENAKACALIAVEEIINNYGTVITYSGLNYDKHFWKEVKEEIEKL